MLRRRGINILQNYNAQKDVTATAIGFKRLIDHRTAGAQSSNNKIFSISTATALQNISQTHNRIPRFPVYFGQMSSEELCTAQKNNNGKSLRDKVLPEGLPCPTLTYTSNTENHICMKSLQDMVLENFHSMEADDYLDLTIKTLRTLVESLWRLHYGQITHGNLKPQNVFICNGECTLASLVDDSSNSLGWKAPEQLRCNAQTKASDIFSFGCVLYFCITGGCHPFGDDPDQRIERILQNKVDLSQVENIPEAFDLISLLLSPKPELRLKANEVASHPLFKGPYWKISVLQCICLNIEYEEEFAGVESTIPTIADPKWRKALLSSDFHIRCMVAFDIDWPQVYGSPSSFGFLSRTVLRIYKHHKDDKWFRRHFSFAEDHLEGMDNMHSCYSIDYLSCDED